MRHKTKHILIVDDEITQMTLISSVVKRAGFVAESAMSGEAALKRLGNSKKPPISLIILDMVMPGLDGLAVIKKVKPTQSNIPVIMLTGQSSVTQVVESMRAGASDFIIKPASADRLLTAIESALEAADLTNQLHDNSVHSESKGGFAKIVGSSPAIKQAMSLAQKASKASIPILLEGESGVGKEVFARAIHQESKRASKPFVAVNCGAISPNLVESILFGHEKGAFTGAENKHIGKFQEADGGTLFLDEVGELPLAMQVKLLRALQEKEIDPVGAKAPVQIDIRIISATNSNMAQQIHRNEFREDLYYRLNVFPIYLPPLRQRQDDIPALSTHFLKELAELENIEPKDLSFEALSLLMEFEWPGNIRQLQNLLYRATILSEISTLDPEDFPQIQNIHSEQKGANPSPIATDTISDYQQDDGHNNTIVTPQNTFVQNDNHVRSLAAVEKEVIATALRHYHGQMSEVARRLGIGRSTLYRKVSEYGLEYIVSKGP